MKLIHCSDLHLDSPMESNLSPRQARERNQEIRSTFSRMVAYAQEHGVSAILIAGDFFDTDRVSARTSDLVLDQIQRAEDLDFYYLRGNHDESLRAFAGRKLPGNLRFFSDRWQTYDYGDLTISGLEFTDDNYETLYDSLRLPPDKTNLVMLHGQISTRTGPELVCLPKLRDHHISYLALGHLHSYQTGKLDLTGTYCYCGCLEGRGFDECGEKGFVELEVRDHLVTTAFVPFARRTLREVSVDMTDLSTAPEIVKAMETAAADISPDSLVKFVLTGSCSPELPMDPQFLADELKDRFYFVKVKDQTMLSLPRETYAHDISLKGEFVRLLLSEDLPQETRDRILRTGLQALRGEEISL